MCELLGRATAAKNAGLKLPHETAADPTVAATLGFLVEQHWLAKDGAGTWTITPAGRFWFQHLNHGAIVKFHEYGGDVFLLHVSSNTGETVVWHRGRFATGTTKICGVNRHRRIEARVGCGNSE